MHPLGRAADVPFFEHYLEEHQKVEIGSSEVNFLQHITEIISLDSVSRNGD